jgi:hypothetical protein
MDSSSYTSGRFTAYFQNEDAAQKACDLLLRVGVPSSAIGLQTLASNDGGGSILTLDDPTHGSEALAIVQHCRGQIQVRHSSKEYVGDSATGTQSSGNP